MRTYTIVTITSHYHNKLKLEAQQEMQNPPAAEAVSAADVEAVYQASLTLEPIREGFGDGMQPARH